jgi:hypothetical protein
MGVSSREWSGVCKRVCAFVWVAYDRSSGGTRSNIHHTCACCDRITAHVFFKFLGEACTTVGALIVLIK